MQVGLIWDGFPTADHKLGYTDNFLRSFLTREKYNNLVCELVSKRMYRDGNEVYSTKDVKQYLGVK